MMLMNPYRFAAGGGPPPPATDPYWANVVLLMHFDGSDGQTTTTDSSSYARSVSSAGSLLPTLSTTDARFGATAALFTGGGNSAFTCAASADTQFGTGDFTVEMWLRAESFGTSPYVVSNRRSSSGLGWYITLDTAGVVSWGWDGGLASFGYLTATTWQYLAFRRASGVLECWVDGTRSGAPLAHTVDYQLVDRLMSIGRDNSSGNNLNGRVDELRITKGVARDVSAVPTAAFPTG